MNLLTQSLDALKQARPYLGAALGLVAAAARAAGIEAGVAAGGAPEVEKAQIGKGWNRIKGEFVAVYV